MKVVGNNLINIYPSNSFVTIHFRTRFHQNSEAALSSCEHLWDDTALTLLEFRFSSLFAILYTVLILRI